MNGNRARVITVATNSGARFFVGFGKGGRVNTAWSLAGAKLFLEGGESETFTKLYNKGKYPATYDIGLGNVVSRSMSLCSGHGVFPDGGKCAGCKDCK